MMKHRYLVNDETSLSDKDFFYSEFYLKDITDITYMLRKYSKN